MMIITLLNFKVEHKPEIYNYNKTNKKKKWYLLNSLYKKWNRIYGV